jgi:hypothetical protein
MGGIDDVAGIELEGHGQDAVSLGPRSSHYPFSNLMMLYIMCQYGQDTQVFHIDVNYIMHTLAICTSSCDVNTALSIAL